MPRFVEMAQSESNPLKEYEVIIEFYDEGCKNLRRISCNCPAWLYPKATSPHPLNRSCKHTKKIAKKYGL